MEKGIGICKVCGKQYEYCKTPNYDDKFRWQDVACCEEHGAIYFKQVEEARARARREAEEAEAIDKLKDIDEPSSVVMEDEPDDDERYTEDDVQENQDQDNELAEEFVIDARYDDEEAVG